MTYILETRQVATRRQAVSHRHARGLTRDLLRKVRDREPGFAPLDRLLRKPLLACGSAQERQRVVTRLRSVLRQHSVVHQTRSLAHGSTASGLRLTTARIPWADAGLEDLLMVQRARLHVTGTRLEVSNTALATISHHAISRMFERLATTHLGDAMGELEEGLRHLSDIFDSCDHPGIGRRVLQIALPTPQGAFLGWRSRGSESFLLRTWVATGGNPRIDRTQAAIKAWAATPAADKLSTFRQMLSCRENHWLLQPHIA